MKPGHPQCKHDGRAVGTYDRAWQSSSLKEVIARLESEVLTDWNDETQRHNVERRRLEWVEHNGERYDRTGKPLKESAKAV